MSWKGFKSSTALEEVVWASYLVAEYLLCLVTAHAIFRDHGIHALPLVEAWCSILHASSWGYKRNNKRLKSLISRKCKCQSPNKLHLYIADGKSFSSVYCVNVRVQPLLHTAHYYNGSFATDTPQTCSIPWGNLDPHLIHGSVGSWIHIRHLNWFSRFRTDQSRGSLYFAMDRHFSHKNCRFSSWDLQPHLICGSLGPPDTAPKRHLY